MIRSSKVGWAANCDNMGVFPLAALAIVVGTIDTARGCAILSGCRGLFKGAS